MTKQVASIVQTLENSTATLWGHPESVCLSDVCPLHKRTNHHMRSWPQLWRRDRYIFERVCPHGIGHPDPDDIHVLTGEDDGTHGCDGCCGIKETI